MLDSNRYIGEGCEPCKGDTDGTIHDYDDPYCIWHDDVYEDEED